MVETQAIQILLTKYSELLGKDISSYFVYGSPMRPMLHAWARIDGAVYMQVSKSLTGYHTYVAVPAQLSEEVVKQYELVFIAQEKSEKNHGD